MNNIFAQLMGGHAAGSAASGMNSNLMGDYMQQIMQNPQQLESIMSTPHMQSMLQMVAGNPEMARLLVDSNPQLAANPEMRDQVTRALPQMMQQVRGGWGGLLYTGGRRVVSIVANEANQMKYSQ